jgi:hypothetical protein
VPSLVRRRPATDRRELVSMPAGSRELMQRLCTKVTLLGSRLPGPVGRAVIGWAIERRVGRRFVIPRLAVRNRYEATRPFDPLSDGRDVPPIEVFIPCVVKDLPTLRAAIEGARFGSRNPISQITVCAPQKHVDTISAEVGTTISVVAEEDVRQSPVGWWGFRRDAWCFSGAGCDAGG